MRMDKPPVLISVMLAVPDAAAAVEWYKRALGAVELWNLGPVVGLEIAGAPFFVGQPEKNGWESPTVLGITTQVARGRQVATESPSMILDDHLTRSCS